MAKKNIIRIVAILLLIPLVYMATLLGWWLFDKYDRARYLMDEYNLTLKQLLSDEYERLFLPDKYYKNRERRWNEGNFCYSYWFTSNSLYGPDNTYDTKCMCDWRLVWPPPTLLWKGRVVRCYWEITGYEYMGLQFDSLEELKEYQETQER